MRTTIKLISSAVLVAAIAAVATASTRPAKSVMDDAYAKAKQGKKNVMLIFHASWCGWCHKMDAMLESKEFKDTFGKSYVITHIDVMEQPAKKDLENEGGADLMAQYGGEQAGLPFFVILSPDGTKLADSILPKTGNMGYPAEPNEVAGFKTILENTAPHMSQKDISRITTFLATKQPTTATGH